MLKELNDIAIGLLGLHGYRTTPLQWRETSTAGIEPPRPIVPRAPLRNVRAKSHAMARTCAG